ncbi:hypothetical protein NLI96_g12275 [Meripilus lineatus]|uniref:Uncharacterized protein n=1 Tax=Meripilus lineatus TaxID=2056292 RepID=A0AAD5Y7R2_9APHY|nr:hypothetical protein NLI96_g12275 [Physisporinus lineatus]
MSTTPCTPHSRSFRSPTPALSVVILPESVSCTLTNTITASPEAGSGDSPDTLHQEFMESALGSLIRQLPSPRFGVEISPRQPRPICFYPNPIFQHHDVCTSALVNDSNVGPRDPHEDHSPLQTRSQSPFSSTLTCIAEEDFYSGCKSPKPVDDRTLDNAEGGNVYGVVTVNSSLQSLLKPEGDFVTLFNALSSHEALEGEYNISSLYGYGLVTRRRQPLAKRNMPQRAIDAIQSSIGGCFHSGSRPHVIRRHSTQLRSGHKTAHLVTESTVYEYIEDLAVPKAWFKANIDLILELYGKSHELQKEDVLLVVGTLEAPNYAIFVSDDHPDAQLDFNVFSSPRPSQPWGQFSISKASFLGSSRCPVYDEDVPKSVVQGKVSIVQKDRKKADAVLLARLRFQPGREDPTSR